jgi:hypothetical protein
LDKQQQSMATTTNQAPVIWRKDDKQSFSTQYFGTKAAKQAPVFGTKATNQEPVLSTIICIHTSYKYFYR